MMCTLYDADGLTSICWGTVTIETDSLSCLHVREWQAKPTLSQMEAILNVEGNERVRIQISFYDSSRILFQPMANIGGEKKKLYLAVRPGDSVASGCS